MDYFTFVPGTVIIRFTLIRYILWGLMFFGLTDGLTAQQNQVSWEYNYRHFGRENELPSSETYQVYQDRSGLLWILTDRGVVRYDGFESHIYTTQDGLCDNVNFRICEDSEGGIWFSGFNGLLSVFKDGEMRPYKYNHVLKKIVPQGRNPYISFCVNKDQSVVFSVYGLGIVVRIDKNGKIEQLSTGYYGKTIFFETDQELLCLRVNHKFPDVYFVQKNKKKIAAGKLVTAGITRIKKHKGFQFFLTYSKLYVHHDKRFELLINEDEVISLDVDRHFLYVGFYKGGLKKYRFNPKTCKLTFIKHYLPNYSVSSAYSDLNQTLWITTLEKGVFALPDEAFEQLVINNNVFSEEVRFIDGNKDKIIITQYVGKWQQLYPPYLCKDVGKILRRFNLVPVNDGFVFQKGIVDWSGWKDVDDSYSLNPVYTRDSFVVGVNYFATEIGEINRKSIYKIDLRPAKQNKLSRAYVWFYIMKRKKAFIVYDTGVNVFDIKNGRITGRYRSVLDKSIRQMRYNDAWGLIAVSDAHGLYRINMEKEIGEPLASTTSMGKQILNIFFDEKDRLWVVSGKGLFLLVKKGERTVCKRFIHKKLFSSAEISNVYSYNDLVYLATKYGVQKIDFLKVKKQKNDCPLELFSIRAFIQNKEASDKHVFQSETDLIKISLLNKYLEGSVEYRYRFGTDQTWIKTNKGEIILNNPSAGTYNLEVCTLDSFNKWTNPKQVCSFTVEKIVFLRWYFLLLYIGLVILLFYVILRFTVRAANRKNELLNRMMELERMALSAQMNPHFIFNSLNSIHSFLLYEENENAEKYLLRFAKLIRQTLSNSRMSYITVEEEYETLKNYILLEKMRFKDAFTFEIVCDLQSLPVNPCIPPMLIQPYIENAILHGLVKRSGDGVLRLEFLPEADAIKVIIEDNGVGYTASKKKKRDSNHKSYGTQITEERLKSLKKNKNREFTVSISNLDDSNEEFPGTRVVLVIPIPD